MEPLLLTIAEAAQRLNLSRSKTYEMVYSGALPSIRIGSSVRIPIDALKGWIEDHTRIGDLDDMENDDELDAVVTRRYGDE